jgi:hypothetical protein
MAPIIKKQNSVAQWKESILRIDTLLVCPGHLYLFIKWLQPLMATKQGKGFEQAAA